jgi:hypothetical protein
VGYAFRGLYQDCKSAKDPNKETAGNAQASCVGAGISAIAGIVSAADLSARVVGSIREYHINNPNFRPMQNWRNAWHNRWFGQKKAKRGSDMLMRRDHEHLQGLSKRFGSEVRHVGYWTDNESRVVRRDGEPKEVPVLAARLHGEDLHYAYLGQDSDGKHHFKMGLDLPEQATKEALAKRADVDPWLHGVFFTKGGLNFWGQQDPIVSKEVPIDTDEEFGWLYDQVSFHGLSEEWNTKKMAVC